MRKIRTGDDVIVVAGKDKGKRGNVTKVASDGRIFVEGINMVKRHTKANPNAGVSGGIIEKEASMHVSNLMVFNSKADKGDRIGFKILEDGRKVRYFKSDNEILDI